MTLIIQMELQTHFAPVKNHISLKKSGNQFTLTCHLSDIRNKATKQKNSPINEIIPHGTPHPRKE